jgi:hydroxymethylpyrimidine/phosphomethylpyrimidine kinase
LPDHYHGSGCTLAASIAALMAHGLEPLQAVTEAQDYTWNSLHAAYQVGKGQHNPNRFFWMEEDA